MYSMNIQIEEYGPGRSKIELIFDAEKSKNPTKKEKLWAALVQQAVTVNVKALSGSAGTAIGEGSTLEEAQAALEIDKIAGDALRSEPDINL